MMRRRWFSTNAIGSDGTVYVGSQGNKLYAINGKSGAKLWEIETGVLVVSSPAIRTATLPPPQAGASVG